MLAASKFFVSDSFLGLTLVDLRSPLLSISTLQSKLSTMMYPW